MFPKILQKRSKLYVILILLGKAELSMAWPLVYNMWEEAQKSHRAKTDPLSCDIRNFGSGGSGKLILIKSMSILSM